METAQETKPKIEQPKSGSSAPSSGSEQTKQSPVAEDFSAPPEEGYSGLEIMKGVQFQYMDNIVVGIAGLKKNNTRSTSVSTILTAGMITSLFEIIKWFVSAFKSNTNGELLSLCIWFIILVLCFVIFFLIVPYIETGNNEKIATIKNNLCYIYKPTAKEKMGKSNNKTRVIFDGNNNIDFEASRKKYNENEGKNETKKGFFQKVMAKIKAIVLLVLLSISSFQAFAQSSIAFPQHVTNGEMKFWHIILFVIILLIIFTSILSMLRSMRMRREIELLSQKLFLLEDELNKYRELKYRNKYQNINPEKEFESGKNAFSQGDYTIAIELFTNAINSNSQRSRYYDYRADAFVRIGDMKKAQEDYENALKLTKDNSIDTIRISHKLAALFNNLGNAIVAERYYKSAIKTISQIPQNDAKKNYGEIINCLNDYATMLMSVDRLSDAEDILERASEICSKLESNSEKQKTLLAMTYNNSAILQKKLLKLSLAEKNYNQALRLYRELDNTNPEKYLPDVAMVFNNLGSYYKSVYRYDEAKKAYGESLKIRRNWANQNPGKYLTEVADTLNNYANLNRDMYNYDIAEEQYNEALSIFRQLVEGNKDEYLSGLATTLYDLAALYNDTKRFDEAEHLYQEALVIRRKLAENNSDAHRYDISGILHRLGYLKDDLKEYEEAEKYYQQALDIRKKLAEKNPVAFLRDVAMTLNNLANLYDETGRLEEAEECYQEAIGYYRQLLEKAPESILPNLAMTLNNLANLHGLRTKKTEEAEKEYKESLAIRRKLAEKDSDTFLPDVAMTIFCMADMHSNDLEKQEEAEQEYKEAIDLYRKLLEKNQERFLPDLANTLLGLALHYSIYYYKVDETEEKYKEALECYRQLSGKNPDEYLQLLAITLLCLSTFHSSNNRYDEAEKENQEALTIFRQLAEKDSDSFQSVIENILYNLNIMKS